MESFDVERTLTGNQEKKKATFKIVGQMVVAMKRFQAALNPTYTYGSNKRPGSPNTNGVPKGRSVSARTSSGSHPTVKTLSGRPESAGKQHGYKANLLFKPLPALSSEQETQA